MVPVNGAVEHVRAIGERQQIRRAFRHPLKLNGIRNLQK